MRIAQEEIFGPVLSVLGFKEPEEAVAIANGTPYGLVASVWTNSLHRALTFARDLDVGRVYINTYVAGGAVIGVQSGGWKRSGFGHTAGQDAILEYTHTKTVIINAGK